MKPPLIRRLLTAFITAALGFSSPVFGQDSTDMLNKALNLVLQVASPRGNPPSDAQRIESLSEALTLTQQAPNHRLKGHRVKAIQDIRAALGEIRKGDPDHKAPGYLGDAQTELSASISLAANMDAPQPAAQTPVATTSPTNPPPASQPLAGQSVAKRQVIVHFDLPKGTPLLTGNIRVSYSEGQKTDRIPVENSEARIEVPVPNQVNLDPDGLDGYSFEVRRISVAQSQNPEQITIPVSPAGAIRCELVEADGSPAHDILVTPQATQKDSKSPQFQTHGSFGGEGMSRFVATPLPFGADYALVVRRGNTFVISPTCHIDEKTPVQNVKVIIPEGKTLRRHFVDREGKPAPGLEFTMNYITPWEAGFEEDIKMVTDAGGWLTIQHFNSDCPGNFRLRCESRATYVPLEVTLDPSQSEQQIQVTKGKVITGIVKDALTGKPISGMGLYALYVDCAHPKPGRPWNEWFDAEAPTDNEGRFRFSNLAEDNFTLHFRSGDCGDPGVQVTTRGGQNEPVILNFKSQPKVSANQIQDAAAAGDLEKVKALVQASPDMVFHKGKRDFTPLLAAAEKNRKEVVEFLLANKADVDARDVFGMTALHHVTLWGRVASHHGGQDNSKDLAALLIANKTDVNARDMSGLTPLHYAAQSGNKEVVQLLLANHADVNARSKGAGDRSGDTPLHLAVSSGHQDIVEVLLAHKADLNAIGNDGLTPLQLADSHNQEAIADLLDPANALAAQPTPTASVDAGAATKVITHLLLNASKKPPGPVEEDITDDAIEMGRSMEAWAGDKTPVREGIASEFNDFSMEGPLSPIYAEGFAAIFQGKAKLTPCALAEWKKWSDDNSGLDGMWFIDGSVSVAGPKLKNPNVMATFCMVRERGLWKVVCLYFSNDAIKEKALPIEALSKLAAKCQEPPIPSGYAILHHFGDGSVPSDGCNPRGSLYLNSGDEAFYGVTQDKGNSNSGTIYRMTAQGKETVLHAFDGPSPVVSGLGDQSSACPLTTGFDSHFWGTTKGGGRYNGGTAFEVSRHRSFKVVNEFGDPDAKDGPRGLVASLILGANGMCGTSESGGTAGHGTIFKIDPYGKVTVLHNFGDGSVPGDGYAPRVPLMNLDNYYGTTSGGPGEEGKPQPKGALFKMTPEGKLTILHRFGDGTVPNDGNASGQVGLYPGSIDDTFYGTTEFGGAANNGGTFFCFTAKGAFKILHVFGDKTPNDGLRPQPTLIQGPDGDFYGTTAAGGSANNGTIYKITTEGKVSILHNFGDGTVPNDGIKPEGGLVLCDGCFYGTATEGGSVGKGIVFRIKIPHASEATGRERSQ